MVEIYSVESRKGGVGKTTIALNLAKALAKKKYDVLLIDCDITGTPITKAAWHSPFWKRHVMAAFKGHPDLDGKPFNLISYYKNVFLKGKESEQKTVLRHETIKGKIHLIGSDIYDDDGNIIIDPRDLMDDLHSYWFLDMIKEITENYCKDSTLPKQAIVLDNSPGYVGIGKSIREWLTTVEQEKARFVLVSSLDEQDIASTLSTAIDIQKCLPEGRKIEENVRVVINKVPDELLTEGGGYNIIPGGNDKNRELAMTLFPLDQKKYPKNIVRYDTAISGQFIEASLLPKIIVSKNGKILDTAMERLEKRILLLRESRKPYTDVTYLTTAYHTFLRELNNAGYARMSKTLGSEEFLPETFLKRMNEQVGLLGSMAHPNPNVIHFSKNDIKGMEMREMESFLSRNHLEQYYSLFMSLLAGLLKKAGIDRKDANIFQLVNLAMMLRGFYAIHVVSYDRNSDYRTFLKTISKNIRKIKFRANDVTLGYPGLQNVEFTAYSRNLINAHFKDFFENICYALLRMIDFEDDYLLIVRACRDTMEQKAKMMSESLVTYMKRVVYRKSEEQDKIRYRQLSTEPFEMKSIQRLITKHVLS
jgi:hypothetical protein